MIMILTVICIFGFAIGSRQTDMKVLRKGLFNSRYRKKITY